MREYYPGALAAFGTDLARTDALAVLSIAPTPELGRGLSRSKIASALRKGGRQRNIERRAPEIQDALRAEYLEAPEPIANAHGLITRSALTLIATFNAQIAELEVALSEHFDQHPDAKVVLSLPGLGRSSVPGCWVSSVMTELGARVPVCALTAHFDRRPPCPEGPPLSRRRRQEPEGSAPLERSF